MALLNLQFPRIAAVLVALLSSGGGANSTAQPADTPAPPAGPVDRHSVYAAFTLNLTRFVRWPDHAFASPESPLVLGTFARDPISDALETIVRGESLNGRPIQTLRLRALDDVTRCHVVFVSGTEAQQRAVLARVAGKPILTISDASGFLELGGHVRFVPRPPHTRLRISQENMRASQLEAQSQLLRLAEPDAP